MNLLRRSFLPPVRRKRLSLRARPVVEQFEARQLLTGGPLQITILEVETGQSYTIFDNNVIPPNNTIPASQIGVDTNTGLGNINVSALNSLGTPLLFTDFTFEGVSCTSNRLAATTEGSLIQSGTITRVANANGMRTLRITTSDQGYTNPTNLAVLTSTSSVTFNNPTANDFSTFQSFVNTVASPVVTLAPNPLLPISSKSGSASPTMLTDLAPYDLKNVYEIHLEPKGATPVSARFLDTGTTKVLGTNPLTIAGTVFSDLNSNNLKDLAGENGLAGVTITLTGLDSQGNNVNLTTTTAADGSYQFTNLNPSSPAGYTITEAAVPGYAHEGQIPGSTGGTTGLRTITTVLPALTNSINNNFSEEQFAAVSGSVYVDANNDGIRQSSETGIALVPVALSGLDSLGNVVSLSTTTDANGDYSFPNLRPGTYTVTETQPSAYLDGLDARGISVLSGSNTTDVIGAIVAGPGQTASGNNFGELLAASIAGSVYVDSNNDGVRQSGETGIAGVTVALSGTDDLGNNVNATASTDPTGAYSFTGLRPGTYVLTESQPPAYLDGKDRVGSSGGTLGNDELSGISLAPSADAVDYLFGELNAASLSGFVYEDGNDNGVKESGESGIEGVTVTLSGTDDLGQLVNLTATTVASGFYEFTGLRPGTYTLTETQPGDYLDGKDSVGSQGGMAANDVFSAIVLDSGTHGINNNFGEIVKPTDMVAAGTTATIGFWNNKNGQAIILAMNGDAGSKALGNYLATTYPRLYGSLAGSNNLTDKTNTEVAAYYKTLFNVKGQKLQAQVMSTALATYVTSTGLNTTTAGQNLAKKYGFTVNATGTGALWYNVGTNGAAFGVANGSILTVADLLKKANNAAVNGVLWAGDTTSQNMANTVFDGINQTGDI